MIFLLLAVVIGQPFTVDNTAEVQKMIQEENLMVNRIDIVKESPQSLSLVSHMAGPTLFGVDIMTPERPLELLFYPTETTDVERRALDTDYRADFESRFKAKQFPWVWFLLVVTAGIAYRFYINYKKPPPSPKEIFDGEFAKVTSIEKLDVAVRRYLGASSLTTQEMFSCVDSYPRDVQKPLKEYLEGVSETKFQRCDLPENIKLLANRLIEVHTQAHREPSRSLLQSVWHQVRTALHRMR